MGQSGSRYEDREDSGWQSRVRSGLYEFESSWNERWEAEWPPTRNQRWPRFRAWRRHRPRLARAILILAVVVILFGCVAPGIFVAQLALAGKDGVARLQQMQTLVTRDGADVLLNPTDRQQVRDQLVKAHSDFARLDQAARWGGPLVSLSGAGSDTARLIQVALHLTNAGTLLLDGAGEALVPLLSNPLAANQPALTATPFARFQDALQRANGEITAAATLSAGIDVARVNGLFGSKAGTLLAKLPQVARIVDQVTRLAPSAPDLLGLNAPASYLILALDRSELRTGGGFIGNFGILPVAGGRIGKLSLEDTYLLDADYYKKTHQQAPAIYPWWPYRNGSPIYGWGLRDSALAPDFPTNAATALNIVQAEGQGAPGSTAPPVGALAITVVVMQQVIAIGGGSLILPEYPTHTITAQNLEETIHCFQLGACRNEKPQLQPGDTSSTDRKHFTATLGQALVERVRHFSAPELKAIVQQVLQDIASKDIQIYLVPPTAQGVLSEMGATAAVPASIGDTFFVTDTNIGGNKANTYVSQHEEDVITLLPDGGALHHLLLRTTYQRQGPLYEGSTGQTQYWEYRRVYLPADMRFLGITGYLGGPGREVKLDLASDTHDRGMVGATVAIGDGSALGQCKAAEAHAPPWNCAPQVRDTFVAWYTPNAWMRDAHGLHYSLLVQRQPGANVALTVRLDATHLEDRTGTATLLEAAAQNYDQLSATSPTGYLAQTNAAWGALVAHATTLFDGPLSQDEVVRWNS